MMPAYQIWSCYVTQDADLENFLFCPNSKVTKFLVEKLSTSEVIGQKLTGDGRHSPSVPSGLRMGYILCTGFFRILKAPPV